MTRLSCGHETDGLGHLVCSHLLDTPKTRFFRVFQGHKDDYRLACTACHPLPPDTVSWRSVCNTCFIARDSDHYWDGISGSLPITDAPAPLRFHHRYADFTGDTLLQVVPLPEAPGTAWVGLTDQGVLVELTFTDAGVVTRREIVTLSPSDVALSEPLSLIGSRDGRFLCVAERSATNGVVYDRQASLFTLKLQRDDDNCDVSPFPLAFLQEGERTLLIHGTDPNRLDISDPATGELLTARGPTSYKLGEPEPPHYIDYFHGELALSPDQDFIADNGWVWHPVGVLRSWSSRRWREENVWESEDGLTLRELTARGYFWQGPLCWIDNTTLAVWGYGEDDDWIIPAVCLFDVVSGTMRNWFPGPEVGIKVKHSASELWEIDGALYFDRYLFSTSRHHGIAVWNIETGARLHADPSFAPVAYHPTTREFLTLLSDGTFQLSRLVPD